VNANEFEAWGRLGLNRAGEMMDRLLELLRIHEIEMSVVVYPWPCQLRRGMLESEHASYWRRWTRERGISFLDLAPDFVRTEAAERESAYLEEFIPGDVHWNIAGHRRVADRLLQSGVMTALAPRAAEASSTR
jgi:hypothetical protein